MKAIVHIGTEKTGTSSIQSYLYLNRKKLQKAGFHFVQSAGKSNNWLLPAYCSIDARYSEFFWPEGVRTREEEQLFKQEFIRNFEKEVQSVPKGVHTFIISSEHFHSRIRTEAELDNVYNVLSAHFDEVKIVCYVREQVDACISHYSTHMKSGGRDSFLTFLQRCKPSNYYFNYYEVLANWERCFGREALDVSLFARDRFLNADLLDDFTAKIDRALVGVLKKSVVVENESLRPFGQALARAINIAFPANAQRPDFNDFRVRCKVPIVRRLSGKGQQPGPEARKLIYESFIESNERLRQKFFPDIAVLFPPPTEVAEPDYFIAEDDFGTIVEVLETIRKHGKGVISTEEYTSVCKAIFSSIEDVTNVVSVTDDVPVEGSAEVGTEVVLSETDAVLLGKAARYLEIRDNDAAVRLMTLASLASPRLLWPKAKLKEYSEAVGNPQKAQYILKFQTNNALSTPEETQIWDRFSEWLVSQDFAGGNILVELNSTRNVNTEGVVPEVKKSGFHGYTILQAESIDAALLLARECPILELGASIEISELNFAWC